MFDRNKNLWNLSKKIYPLFGIFEMIYW
jgi:hypothetical protein